MEYLLEYFDQFNKGSDSSNLDNDIILKEDIRFQIDVETRKIINKMRLVYYSSIDAHIINSYLNKHIDRLQTLINNSAEQIISNIHIAFLFDPSPDRFIQHENTTSIYISLNHIKKIIHNEFKISSQNTNYKIPYSDLTNIISNPLRIDYYMFFEDLSNEDIINYSILDLYHVPFRIFETNKEEIIRMYNQSKKGIYSYRRKVEYSDDIINLIKTTYLLEYNPEIQILGKAAISFLKEKLSDISNKEKKLDIAIEFLIHTNLCSGFILNHYKHKIKHLELFESVDSLNGFLNELKEILMKAQRNPLYSEYNICKLTGEVPITDILSDYLNNCRAKYLNKTISNSQLEDNEKGNKNLKLIYNGNIDSLGLFINLISKHGIIVELLHTELSNAVVNGFTTKNQINKTLSSKSFLNQFKPSNRLNDKETAKQLIKPIEKILAELKEIKNNYN